ncbi:hypothetical protein [Micromonospora sp. L32]|uniref:hypothetical protein n=1 Tax=Micromonospora sp. L32 TaxID=3452214 RepID=UPI003F8A411E
MTVRDIGIIATTGQLAIVGAFHTLFLQPTSFCNLNCSYCYLPDRRSRQLMSVPVATACARVVTPETIGHADDLVEFFTALPDCESVGFNIEEQEGAARTPVPEEAAYRFWSRLVRHRLAGGPLRIRDLDRLADYLGATRAGLTDHGPYEPIPTVAHDGQVVLLSPELLGITSPQYADFIAGNVLREPIGGMLARAQELRYVSEFVTALNDCADRCTFYDFCRSAQAGNRYFEHGTFTARETAYCRTTRQALIRAAADHLTPQGGPS